jgi:hypothetical protein
MVALSKLTAELGALLQQQASVDSNELTLESKRMSESGSLPCYLTREWKKLVAAVPILSSNEPKDRPDPAGHTR